MINARMCTQRHGILNAHTTDFFLSLTRKYELRYREKMHVHGAYFYIQAANLSRVCCNGAEHELNASRLMPCVESVELCTREHVK
jgi:hypothetical protein